MLNSMLSIFSGIFDTQSQEVISVGNFFLCIGVAIILGMGIAFLCTFKAGSTKSFFICLSVVPAVVCVVIMMVNGNIGAGVAVAGAFSLVRFRSAPGTAKEIAAIFLAMAIGLILGMGYIAYAALFAVIIGLFMFGLNMISRKQKKFISEKTLKVTIPEDLNYADIFNDIFEDYTNSCELTHVKTTNMGSLYKLTYRVTLKNAQSEKQMLDEMRVRNGNLEIAIMYQEGESYEL